MRIILQSGLFLMLLCLCAGPAMADGFVGSVKTVSGKAAVVRDGNRIAAVVGKHLFKGDVLLTEADSSLGVIFRDDTMLSMGESSKIAVVEFVFDPAADNVSFLADMVKGTAQFITGQMAKVAPEKMKVKTPLSTIGIRGTRFLVKVD